ncbi:MAG: hypothetical protein ACKPKO_21400, partial [Candidatus Fonsibacter sp.]
MSDASRTAPRQRRPHAAAALADMQWFPIESFYRWVVPKSKLAQPPGSNDIQPCYVEPLCENVV